MADSSIQVSKYFFSPLMSLPSKKNTNPNFMDISDLMVFATRNYGVSNPKGKRKRSPNKNHQASLSPRSVTPPHAMIMLNHHNLAIEGHASQAYASFVVR